MMETGKACSYYAKYANFFNLLCSQGGNPTLIVMPQTVWNITEMKISRMYLFH